ncbi:hypothetical protein WJ02_09980 [Burkholderia vietnamiensis]|nr:hypothetical protein WJ02_09980 [Burkholderia vietnamiensis]KVE92358.1 hypothetical protein WJ01_23705 [Burkholderia vietnamiensis]
MSSHLPMLPPHSLSLFTTMCEIASASQGIFCASANSAAVTLPSWLVSIAFSSFWIRSLVANASALGLKLS